MNKQIFLKNLLAIGFGFLVALAVFGTFAIILIFFPDKFKSTIVDVVIIAATSFTGGFLTASASIQVKSFCSIMTSVLLLLFIGSWMNFSLADNLSQTIVLGATILVSGIAGGLIASLKKT